MIRLISIVTIVLTCWACNPRQGQTSLLLGEQGNCAKIWARYAGQNMPCELFSDTGFPRRVDGVEVTIAHYSEGWTAEQGQVDLLKLVGEAALDAIPVFNESLWSNSIFFRLVPEFSDDDRVADAQLPDASETCEVRIYMTMEMDKDRIKQIIAHEIFHCFEFSTLGGHPTEAGSYWREGAAEYFSSVIYPKTNTEHDFSPLYQPDVPLHKQSNPYSTSIFYQSLAASGLDNSTIAQSLQYHQLNSDADKELQTLTVNYWDMSQQFHNFAKFLVHRAVPDSGGGTVPSPVLSSTEIPARPESNEVKLSAVPLTVNYGHMFLPAASRTKLSLPFTAGKSKVKLSVRLRGEPWQVIEPGIKGEISIEVPCGVDQRKLEIVWTSTANQNEAVTFPLEVRQDGVMSCDCDDTSAEVDACLVGTWDLDIDSMRHYMDQISQGQIRNFQHSGGMNLEITSNFGQFSYQSMNLNFDSGSEANGWQSTSHAYNGYFKFHMLMQRKGEFCMRAQATEGGLVSETSLGRYNFTFREIYDGAQGQARYQYVCDERTLSVKSSNLGFTSPEMIYHRR